MIAKLSLTGLSPNDAAIAGSEVASTVELRFSMNRAQATISGISTARSIAPAARDRQPQNLCGMG